jgi:hypothetical protein
MSNPPVSKHVYKTPVDSIVVGNRHRDLIPEKVAELADSIVQIGLQYPITVAGRHPSDSYDLVIGHDGEVLAAARAIVRTSAVETRNTETTEKHYA